MYNLRVILDVTERWQAKGQRSIIDHGELVVPRSLYACCIRDRIMPPASRSGLLPPDPERIVDAVTEALLNAFGTDPTRMPLQAIVFEAKK
jgi:hypothetical protein